MMTFKQFVIDEALRRSVQPGTVYTQIGRGQYPKLKLHRKNKRVAFVLNKNTTFKSKLIPSAFKTIYV